MKKTYSFLNNLMAAALAWALCGCGNQEKAGSTAPHQGQAGAYFKTPWQDESQFIATAIVSDLAEMAYYSKHKSLPPGQLSVSVTEKPGSPFGSPVYLIEVAFDKSASVVKEELNVNGPIWGPEVYGGVIDKLFTAVGLTTSDLVEPGKQDDQLLSNLASLTARQIAQQNLSVSDALTREFRDAARHENAALLLGAFMLRENSGDFFDIRSPLCRLTAHLALAKKLAGQAAPGLNGKVAEALLFTLMNNQKAALDRLAALDSVSPAAQPWVRALRTRNTGDYRILAGAAQPTGLEKLELFRASCHGVDPSLCWGKLSEQEKLHVCDYARIVNATDYSVETGHELLAVSLAGEMAELAEAYSIAHGQALKKEGLVEALNQMPERCFSADGKAQVRVIGWGQWSMFFQRHVCHALEHNFEFMDKKWGVPDEAKKFRAGTEKVFSGLRLYPFVRRFNATEVKDYHRGVDDAFVVTVNSPQLVSAEIWNNLCYTVSFAELYKPNPNPHINEWHKHNPPPGTAYDPLPRMNHPSLIGRRDTVACLERLHERAPYDTDISYNLLQIKYHQKQTFEQIEQVYRPVLDYDSFRMAYLARNIEDQPAEYEKLMLKAAGIDAYRYYALGDYFIKQNDETKAALYLEKGMKLHPDAVAAASRSGWLIKYYQRHGMASKAMPLADEAAETYSSPGLAAKAELLESLGRYSEALDYYRKIEERYDTPGELMAFLARYKAKTGSNQYDQELQAHLKKLFPGGVETVTLAQLQGPPRAGVRINQTTHLSEKGGLQEGDIIVALYGIRLQTFEQYLYARESSPAPEMDLIVWRQNRYLEVKPSPPNHSFGGKFATWPPK